MHLFTLCLLAVFFPQMLFGMQETKTWDEFEGMIKNGGSYLLMSAAAPVPNDCTNEIDSYCVQHPTFKCYYMLEGITGQPDNSFNNHFKNHLDIIVFYKDGVEKKRISPVNEHFIIADINAGFAAAT